VLYKYNILQKHSTLYKNVACFDISAIDPETLWSQALLRNTIACCLSYSLVVGSAAQPSKSKSPLL